MIDKILKHEHFVIKKTRFNSLFEEISKSLEPQNLEMAFRIRDLLTLELEDLSQNYFVLNLDEAEARCAAKTYIAEKFDSEITERFSER